MFHPRKAKGKPFLIAHLQKRREAVFSEQKIELPKGADEPREFFPRRVFLQGKRTHGSVAPPKAGIQFFGKRLVCGAAVLHEAAYVDAVHHGVEIGRVVAAVVEIEHPELPFGREEEVAVGNIPLHGAAGQAAEWNKAGKKRPPLRRDRFGKAPVFPRKGRKERFESFQREEVVLFERVEEHPPFDAAAAPFGDVVHAGKKPPRRLGKFGRHDGELSLEGAAKAMGLNKEYFCRLFKKNMGVSFLQYVYQIRTTAVCRELETTDDPIGEIAERHGFRDPKMLNHYFREIYGCTPSEKRKFFREVTLEDSDNDPDEI